MTQDQQREDRDAAHRADEATSIGRSACAPWPTPRKRSAPPWPRPTARSVWEQRVARTAAGVKSVMMVAADASTDGGSG